MTVANATFALGQFVVLGLTGRSLGTLGVGQLSLAMAIVTPLMGAFGMSMRSLVQTRPDFGAATFVQLRLIASTLGVVVATAVALVVERGRFNEFVVLTCLLSIARGIDHCSDLFIGANLNRGTLRVAVVSPMLNGLVTATSVGVLLWATPRLDIVGLGSLIGSLLGGFLVPVILFASGRSAFTRAVKRIGRRAALRPLVGTGTPLALSAGFSALSANVGRYLTAGLGSKQLLGQNVMLASIANVFVLPVQGACQAQLSRLRQAVGSQRREMSQTLFMTALVAWAAMFGLAALMGDRAVVALYGPEGSGLGRQFVYWSLACAPYFMAWPLETLVLARTAYRSQMWSTLTSVVVQAAIMVATVGALGLTGVAIAFAVGQTLRCLLLGRVLRRRQSQESLALGLSCEYTSG